MLSRDGEMNILMASKEGEGEGEGRGREGGGEGEADKALAVALAHTQILVVLNWKPSLLSIANIYN